MSALAAEFGTGQVLLSMLYFFLFVIWIWLALTVFGDIFRSDDLSGWGKAWWTLLVVVVPYFGVLVYLIARGGKMHEHAVRTAQARDDARRARTSGARPRARRAPPIRFRNSRVSRSRASSTSPSSRS